MSANTTLGAMSRIFCRTILSSSRNMQKNIYNNARYMCATASKETKNAESGNSPTEEANNSNNIAEDKSAELNNKIEKLTSDLANIKDKYQRTLADRENVRLRLEKQVADTKIFAVQGFCKDLLEVSDVFSKALESVSSEQLAQGTGELKTLYEGLSMTQTQLHMVFRRHGLYAVDAKEGEKFDPSWQEAMFEVPANENQQPGSVVHILRQGWKLKDRCLRSAQVAVAKE